MENVHTKQKNKMQKNKFHLPYAVYLPRKTKEDKRVVINLNNYPKWRNFMYNDVKKAYLEAMRPQLEGFKIQTPCHLVFTLHRKDARMGDRQNGIALHEKFFCDAATLFGCWPDDTDEHIISTTYKTGEIDRVNPGVDLEVIPR